MTTSKTHDITEQHLFINSGIRVDLATIAISEPWISSVIYSGRSSVKASCIEDLVGNRAYLIRPRGDLSTAANTEAVEIASKSTLSRLNVTSLLLWSSSVLCRQSNFTKPRPAQVLLDME
jgi:hypothetical protein